MTQAILDSHPWKTSILVEQSCLSVAVSRISLVAYGCRFGYFEEMPSKRKRRNEKHFEFMSGLVALHWPNAITVPV